MTFFDLGVSEKDAHAAEYMADTNRLLIKLYYDENKKRKLTKAKIAELLGVDKSTVTRMLKGSANLTERSIGELLWALGYRLEQTPVRVCDGNEEVHQQDSEITIQSLDDLAVKSKTSTSTSVGPLRFEAA